MDGDLASSTTRAGKRTKKKRDAIASELERMRSTYVNPAVVATHDALRVLGAPIEREYALADLLRRRASRMRR